ncbi:MAG: response regulator [Flavobacterium sp.]
MRFLLILIFLHFFGYSQRLHFNSLSVQDGLSQNDVSSIIQDSEGFIWMGTYDGLNRFDGYRIENIFHNNEDNSSLSSNRIQCLYEDNQKRLWIGTDGYGLNYYNLIDGKIKRVLLPVNYRIVNDIKQNSQGEILLATTQGLVKVLEKNKTFVAEILQTPLTGFNVRKLKQLKDGSNIYATSNGVWISNQKEYKLIEGSDQLAFRGIAEVGNSTWVAGTKGLYEIVQDKLIPVESFQNINILSVVHGVGNDLWVSTFNNGLLNYDTKTKKKSVAETFNDNYQYSLSNNSLNFVYKDETNTLWVSNKIGVLYTNLDNKKFKSLPLPLKKHVRTIFTTNDYAIYGYQGDKFYKFIFKTQTSEPIILPENSKPFKVDTLHGKVHLATTNGFFKESNLEKNLFVRVPIFDDIQKEDDMIITSFCKDSNGNEYYGTFKGLILRSKKGAAFINEHYENLESFRGVRVFTLKYDSFSNCIWVGTISDGLFKINISKNGTVQSIERYNEQMIGSYNIPNNSIWCFHQKADGSMYIGTDTGLLVKEKHKEKIQSVLVDNIQNQKIPGVISDDFGNLWLNNSRGIIKYNPKDGQTKKFNSNDGLLTNTFTEAISKNSNGELFFGSILGVNYFKYDELFDNKFPSKVSFTRLIVNNQMVQVNQELFGSVLIAKTLNNTDEIDIHHQQNDFTIQFSSTNYANHKVNKYRYQLKNYDDNWVEVNNNSRFANYSNLPSGNYEFVVEATNSDGQWSGLQRSILFRVHPAPWNTWWAITLYLVLFSLIIFTIFYFWTNKEKLRTQMELSKLKNDQEKEINELKLVFFTDIAHEFKTPLSLIIGPIEDLMRGNISSQHREFCYHILSRNAHRMLNLIKQLLDFRKINSGVNILKVSRNDISTEIKHIVEYFAWEQKNSNIDLRIITPDCYYCHFDRDILEKVVFNILSNAFKYTPFGGIIEVEVKPTWKNDLEYVIVQIKDSGKGIKQEDRRKIFDRHFHGKERSSSGIGLHLSATLVNAHKGEITVTNSSYGGTEFMITLPVSSKAFTPEEYLFEEDMHPVIETNYIPGDIPEDLDELKKETKEKILIVEDDYDLRKYLKNILLYDYQVIEASNGKEGFELCLKEIPDIIITDVMMPELDGVEMCKMIKKNILISHIPVLMLTAKTGDEFSKIGLEAGAWDYISKPFNSSQLLLKLKNIADTRNNFRQLIVNGSVEKTENHFVSYDQKLVQNTKKIILSKISEQEFSAEFLAKELGLSRMQLHRKLNTLIGLSTTAFINKIRIQIAVQMFDNGCDRVQEAMDAVGISSSAHFVLLFKNEKGMNPSKYIEQIKKIPLN